MAFIRYKKVRGITYYSLVESVREMRKVRQRVLVSLEDSPELSEERIRDLRRFAETLTSLSRKEPRRTWIYAWLRHARVPWNHPDRAQAVEKARAAWDKEVAEVYRAKAARCLRDAMLIEKFRRQFVVPQFSRRRDICSTTRTRKRA